MARLSFPAPLPSRAAPATASSRDFAPRSERDGDGWSPGLDDQSDPESDADDCDDLDDWPPDDLDLEIDDEPEPEPGDFWIDADDED